ncbi:hypothetical protein GmHk_14G041349 [Glycine max]|nr:hypothetical protein GmHk_14G041349 [Glycine max]
MHLGGGQGFVFSKGNVSGGGYANEPPDGDEEYTPQPRLNFKQLFVKEVVTDRPKVDLIKENLERIEYEEGNKLKPRVILADSILEGLCAPWKEFFVVKLLGKNIGFTTMHDRLARAWKMPGGFEVLGLGNGYFMVKFDKDEDRKKSH